MSSQEPPVIDFGRTSAIRIKKVPEHNTNSDLIAFYGTDPEAKTNLIEQFRQACEDFGFFQLINHNIPPGLQESVINQAKDLFDLPTETKEKYDKGTPIPLSKTIPN